MTEIQGVFFDYKKSNNYRAALSQYIHTYTRLEPEMKFESLFIQAAFPLIKEVKDFLYKSLNFDGKTFRIQNIDYEKMPDEDKLLLKEWREDKIDETELEKCILKNIEMRRKNLSL